MRVVAPSGELVSFDSPAVSPEVAGVLRAAGGHVVLDAGGDPVGARLAAAHAEPIRAAGYDLWLVANPFRPEVATAEALARAGREIALQAGLDLTGLAANPHLGPATRAADLARGLAVVQEAAAGLGLPLVFLAAARVWAEEAGRLGLPVLPLELVVRLPWEAE